MTVRANDYNGMIEAVDPALGGEPSKGPRPHQDTISLAELMRMELPPPRWAVPGLIPEGLTILASKPKVGKSFLAMGLAVAVGCGGRALGSIEVEQGDVLYLALED